MRRVIKALLAASMLMPVAAQAQAQEQDGRERGQGRRGEWGQRADRPERAAEVGVDAQVRTERPQRAEFRGERQQPAPEARQDAPRGNRDGRDSRGWNRPDGNRPGVERRDWTRDGDRQARDPQGSGRRWNGNDDRRGNDDRQRAGNGWRQPDRDGRGLVQPGFRDDRPDDRRPGHPQGFTPDRSDWRGNDRRDWNDGRRYDNRGGAWNRGWRNDTRYDWNRNRLANRSAYRLPRYYAPSGWGQGYRRFSVGVSLSSILFSRNYWIDDPYAYRLPEAYGPYRWVRYYDDALLVDVRTGQVVDSVYGIFD
jgi:hypothetical protein